MALAQGETITGKNGKITYGNTPGTEVKITTWSIKKTSQPVNTTDNGSGDYEEYKPGKRISWNGSFEGFIKAGDAAVPFNQLIDFEGDADTGINCKGKIIINDEGYTVDVNSGDAVKIQRSFQGSGILTETNTAGA